LKIVFLGTTSFGIPTLDALARAGNEIKGIISTPGREKGRGLKTIDSDIVIHAQKMGYGPILTPEALTSPGVAQELKNLEADLFVVVAFRILPKEIFSIPSFGTYNIHASLLPRYRGPAPIQRAIAAGESETGITVFRIDQGIDTGNVLLQKKVAIGDSETSPQLSERLSQLSALGIVEAVSCIQSNTVALTKQDPSQASRAPKLVKSEGKIVWDLPARAIYNMVRAFTPFPATYTFYDNARLNVEWAVPLDTGDAGEAPGTILAVTKEGFDVQCENSVLRVLRVKPEGKKRMTGREYANGRNLGKGMKFE
jgi:methionyl-tRNA formyltransferase